MSDLGEPVVSEQSKRLLKLVYIMGIILLLLFFALVAGIIYKAKNKPAVLTSTETQQLGIGLPPDEKFTDVVLTGDKLTINAGRIIYVIDVPSHRVILRVDGVQD